MNGYIAFYKGDKKEVWADSLYAAKLKAIELFGVSKRNEYKVSVYLFEKDGQSVTQVITS